MLNTHTHFPFQAQHHMLHTTRKRHRVLVNPQRRMTHSDLADWDGASEKPDLHHNRKLFLFRCGKNCTDSGQQSGTGSQVTLIPLEQETTAPDAQSTAITTDDNAAKTVSGKKPVRCLCGKKEMKKKSSDPPANAHSPRVLRAGDWVAVGIYFTQTSYDVRWQDGSLSTNVPCRDLLPVYFNIDEHDFFPGNVVSLKSRK